jgi:hypothetical protein
MQNRRVWKASPRIDACGLGRLARLATTIRGLRLELGSPQNGGRFIGGTLPSPTQGSRPARAVLKKVGSQGPVVEKLAEVSENLDKMQLTAALRQAAAGFETY